MKAHEPRQLADWFDAHVAPLVLYARQWLNREEAEDVVQEVFTRLLVRRIPRGETLRNERAWLFTAVRNASISAARSSRRRQQREEKASVERPPMFEPDPAASIDASAAEKALASLDAESREVVVLRIWSGLTLAEIAEVTGLSVTTAFHRYRQALDAIRQKLGVSKCTAT